MCEDLHSEFADEEDSEEVFEAEEVVEECDSGSQIGRFYIVHSNKSSFRELWRDARSPAVLIAWMTKLMGVKLPGTVNDPNVVSLRPFVVAEDQVEQTISWDANLAIQPVIRELLDLGFGQAVYYHVDDKFHGSRMCQVAMLNREGTTIARITHRTEGQVKTRTHFHTEFLSQLSGGEFLHTSGAMSQMSVPANCRLNYRPGWSASRLWASHRQALDGVGCEVERVAGHPGIVELLERHHEAVRDFNLERGVFSSMQGADLAHAVQVEANIGQSEMGGMRHPEVLAELTAMQNKKTSWTSAIFVLALTVGLFVLAGAGVWKWSWEFILIIVGVLFVHEAGHYVAMRVFGYRNVRMFFIPFFGAAVSGENYKAPGWKKVIVSLMGPLPGIVLGGVLGIMGARDGNEMLVRVALFAVILNGLQLLPVLPLDGGRVIHTILFSRHYYLNTLFEVMAGGALAVLGGVLSSPFLIALGVFLLIGATASHRIGKLAAQLRPEVYGRSGAEAVAGVSGGVEGQAIPVYAGEAVPVGMRVGATDDRPVWAVNGAFGQADSDEHTIPQNVAERIIDRVKERFPQVKTTKQIAKLAVRVYESACTRPPGVIASLGFAFLHGASFLLAIGLCFGLVISQRPELWSRMRGGESLPNYRIEASDVETWNGSGVEEWWKDREKGVGGGAENGQSKRRANIVATFASSDAARSAFEEVRAEGIAEAELALLGQTVLLGFPMSAKEQRDEWFDWLDARADQVFSDGGDPDGIKLSLMFGFSEQAVSSGLKERLLHYINAPEALYLIPPWLEGGRDSRTDEERHRHNEAREMYSELDQTYVFEDPRVVACDDQIDVAERKGNHEEVSRLEKQRSDLEAELLLEEYRRIRDAATSAGGRALSDRYVAMKEAEHAESEDGAEEEWQQDESYSDFLHRFYAREREELGPLMGQLELSGDRGRPSGLVERYLSYRSYASETIFNHLLLDMRFEDAAVGAPMAVKWLDSQGCEGIRYEFRDGRYRY